jgi:hypothetical protein
VAVARLEEGNQDIENREARSRKQSNDGLNILERERERERARNN